MTEWLHFHFSLSCIGEGNGNPLQYSCLENPRNGGAWWAAVYGVAQSRTRLKRLSSSSRNWYISFVLLVSMVDPIRVFKLFSKYLSRSHFWLCILSLAGENAEVSMDVSLAYRDDMFAEWTEMAHERVPRKLKCTFTSPKVGYLDVLVDGVFIWFPGMWEHLLRQSPCS